MCQLRRLGKSSRLSPCKTGTCVFAGGLEPNPPPVYFAILADGVLTDLEKALFAGFTTVATR